MDAPSDHIVVLYRVHILPSKLQMLPQRETMDVDPGSSAKHVCFSAKLLSPAYGEDLN